MWFWCAVHQELGELFKEACALQAQALAGSSQRQYHAHVRWFAEFCVVARCEHCFDRPTEQLVMAYAAYLFRSVRADTVVQYLKGLKGFYRDRGYSEFAVPEQWTGLHRVLKGIKRADKAGALKKQPITPEMLAKFGKSMDTDKGSHAALWACCLITFFGYFRKSNTTVPGGSPMVQGKCVRVTDVRVDWDQYALVISVQSSKTRQMGPGPPPVRIAGVRGHALDPVGAWIRHVSVNMLEGPATQAYQAFSYRAPEGGLRALLHADLVLAGKQMAEMVGVDPASVAGHSFRRGGASYAFRAGVPDVLIQHQGDWRSMAYREYLTLPPAKALEATRAMFRLMQQPVSQGGFGAGVLQAGLQPVDNAVGARLAVGGEGLVAVPLE